jgi:hypothetical protein
MEGNSHIRKKMSSLSPWGPVVSEKSENERCYNLGELGVRDLDPHDIFNEKQ